jgi:hypothetical protein
METMQGISLYSYPYLKLAKTLCLTYYHLHLLFNKIEKEDRIGSAWKRGEWGEREGVEGREEIWPKQCMHI